MTFIKELESHSLLFTYFGYVLSDLYSGLSVVFINSIDLNFIEKNLEKIRIYSMKISIFKLLNAFAINF